MAQTNEVTITIRADAGQAERILKAVGKDAEANLGKSERASRRAAAAYAELDSQTARMARSHDKLMGTLKRALGFTALVTGVRSAVTAYAEFEAKLTEVSTLVDTSTVKMDAFKKAIVRLAKESGTPVADLTQGLYDLISAGVATKDATKVLAQANKLAVGGFTSVATAVDALTGVMNNYKLAADQAQTISDQLFTVVKLGKTTMEQLGPAIGRVASATKAAGVSTSEMFAAMAELTKVTGNTNESTTKLVGLMKALAAPTEQAQKAAAKMGIKLGEAELKSRGLKGMLEQLARATGGSLQQMVKLIPEVEAAQGALILADKGAAGFAKALAEVEKAAKQGTATQKAYDKAMATSAKKIAKAREQWEALKRTVGKGLILAFGAVAKFLKGPFTKAFVATVVAIRKAWAKGTAVLKKAWVKTTTAIQLAWAEVERGVITGVRGIIRGFEKIPFLGAKIARSAGRQLDDMLLANNHYQDSLRNNRDATLAHIEASLQHEITTQDAVLDAMAQDDARFQAQTVAAAQAAAEQRQAAVRETATVAVAQAEWITEAESRELDRQLANLDDFNQGSVALFQQMADDAAAAWTDEDTGFLAGIGIALKRYSDQVQETSSIVSKDLVDDMKAAERGISDTFFDALHGKFHSLGDIVSTIAGSIYDSLTRAFSDVVASKAMSALLGLGAKILGDVLSHKDAIIGAFKAIAESKVVKKIVEWGLNLIPGFAKGTGLEGITEDRIVQVQDSEIILNQTQSSLFREVMADTNPATGTVGERATQALEQLRRSFGVVKDFFGGQSTIGEKAEMLSAWLQDAWGTGLLKMGAAAEKLGFVYHGSAGWSFDPARLAATGMAVAGGAAGGYAGNWAGRELGGALFGEGSFGQLATQIGTSYLGAILGAKIAGAVAAKLGIGAAGHAAGEGAGAGAGVGAGAFAVLAAEAVIQTVSFFRAKARQRAAESAQHWDPYGRRWMSHLDAYGSIMGDTDAPNFKLYTLDELARRADRAHRAVAVGAPPGGDTAVRAFVFPAQEELFAREPGYRLGVLISRDSHRSFVAQAWSPDTGARELPPGVDALLGPHSPNQVANLLDVSSDDYPTRVAALRRAVGGMRGAAALLDPGYPSFFRAHVRPVDPDSYDTLTWRSTDSARYRRDALAAITEWLRKKGVVYHSGGEIPGVPGAEVPILAQAGEHVVTRADMGDVVAELEALREDIYAIADAIRTRATVVEIDGEPIADAVYRQSELGHPIIAS